MDGFGRKGCAEDPEEAGWRDMSKIIQRLFKSGYEKGNRCEMSVKMDGMRNALSGQKMLIFGKVLIQEGWTCNPPLPGYFITRKKKQVRLLSYFTRGGLNLHHQLT